MMTNPIAWAAHSLRGRGVLRTLQVAGNFLDNWWFDMRHRTDTAPVIELVNLDVTSHNIRFGHEYRASKAKPLRQLLKGLQLPPNSVFVDFGSGKGKAMVIASEFPFQRVVGVEFSGELCAKARLNLLKYTDEAYGERCLVIESDATQYEFRDDENVLYFYNPFAGEVIELVLIRLQESLMRRPRTVWVLYFAPEYREVFDRSHLLELDSQLVLGGADHLVYCHRPRSG